MSTGPTRPARVIPGDYDGAGRTDLAAYLLALTLVAVPPSSGGVDVVQCFGLAGVGQSMLGSSILDSRTAPSDGTVSATAVDVPPPG